MIQAEAEAKVQVFNLIPDENGKVNPAQLPPEHLTATADQKNPAHVHPLHTEHTRSGQIGLAQLVRTIVRTYGS